MYVDNATVAVLGLMGLVSLLNWGFILISINYSTRNGGSLKTTGMAYSMTGVEDVVSTSTVSDSQKTFLAPCLAVWYREIRVTVRNYCGGRSNRRLARGRDRRQLIAASCEKYHDVATKAEEAEENNQTLLASALYYEASLRRRQHADDYFEGQYDWEHKHAVIYCEVRAATFLTQLREEENEGGRRRESDTDRYFSLGHFSEEALRRRERNADRYFHFGSFSEEDLRFYREMKK